MKTTFKKLFTLCAIIAATAFTVSFTTPQPAYADCRYFLGMTSWDCGTSAITDEEGLKNSIAIIAANVLTDLTVIASYLVIAYVIYGGYLYIFSSGDPGKVMTGKKTLTQAFIGLAIVMLAHVILSAIRIALLGGDNVLGDCTAGECVDGSDGTLIIRLIQWVVGVGGIVAAVFVVMGAISYITSSGDPSKVQKAKTTITYALIGLAVVALAEIITAFVANMIRDANTTSSLPPQTIATTNIIRSPHEN